MASEQWPNIEEKVASLFQVDTLLPAEYFATFRRKVPLEPEKKLMLAILEDAVACLQKYCLASDKRRRGLFRETEEWLMEENNDSIFSFENICETLGFSPQYIRQGLLRWKEMKLAGTRPKTNVYRLTSRAEKKKARSQMAVTPEQKFSKVAGS